MDDLKLSGIGLRTRIKTSDRHFTRTVWTTQKTIRIQIEYSVILPKEENFISTLKIGLRRKVDIQIKGAQKKMILKIFL